jgi:hypothetical protein
MSVTTSAMSRPAKPIAMLIAEAQDIAEQAAVFYARLTAKGMTANVAVNLTGSFVSGLTTRAAIERMNDDEQHGEDWKEG